MSAHSVYRGYEIRHRTVRDGEGFARYNAEIKVGGEWQLASCEALDDETIERDLDAFIDEINSQRHPLRSASTTARACLAWMRTRSIR